MIRAWSNGYMIVGSCLLGSREEARRLMDLILLWNSYTMLMFRLCHGQWGPVAGELGMASVSAKSNVLTQGSPATARSNSAQLYHVAK